MGDNPDNQEKKRSCLHHNRPPQQRPHAHRRNEVVPCSLAEACIFFDVPLGAAVVVLMVSSLR
jgi:hypothetical protein